MLRPVKVRATCPYMALTHDKVFQMRSSEEFLRRIDDWRREQTDIPSRAEAIRRLIELGLEAAKQRQERTE